MEGWQITKNEEIEVNCTTCFYSQESTEYNSAVGRVDGVESESETVVNESCTCFEGPDPLLISEQMVDGIVPDVLMEPSYHKCGRGRWWKNGKWVKWIDIDG